MGKKTENKSLRFNPDHLAFAKEKTGIEKEQELIDRLLSDFFEAWNPQPNYFTANIVEIKENGSVVSSEANSATNSPNPTQDAPKEEKDQNRAEIEAKIKELENDRDNVPSFVGGTQKQKAYKERKQAEIDELKKQLL